jgi:hypothetical protein
MGRAGSALPWIEASAFARLRWPWRTPIVPKLKRRMCF